MAIHGYQLVRTYNELAKRKLDELNVSALSAENEDTFDTPSSKSKRAAAEVSKSICLHNN